MMFSYRAGWSAGGVIGSIVGWFLVALMAASVQSIITAIYLVCIPLILFQGNRVHWAIYPMAIASVAGLGYGIYQYYLLHTVSHLPSKQVIMFSVLPPYLFSGLISAIFATIAGVMDWLQVVRKTWNR